ncbi:MAG: hypothetical protein AAF366_03465 [Pseudomonadota bacterium]
MAAQTAVDGHVHIYPGMNVAALLGAAANHLGRLATGADPCLLLTETARDDGFDQLASGGVGVEGWEVVEYPEDPAALSMRDADGRLVTLVAGRQIVTAERLEVLALATHARFDDGRPVDDVLADLTEAGVPAVLPWGLGKWVGERGRILRRVLDRWQGKVLLGDNAGRPLGWPRPSVFDRGPVLPGTDPLPLGGRESDVGRYGFVLPGAMSTTRPAADLADRLRALRAQPRIVGQRLGPMRVVADQVALRR